MNVFEQFSQLSEELCSHLYLKEYDKSDINALIDELNAKPYNSNLFVRKEDAAALVTSLCFNIKPVDEFLSTKTSHLINSLVTKQSLKFGYDFLFKVVAWHIECIKTCSDIILPDILHNLQCILQTNPQSGSKVVISGLRVLSYIYFNDSSVNLSMPEIIGICRYFILYALIVQGRPDRIMPSQQTIAAEPVKIQPKGGKKQKIRKHRNNAIESLKKEIPVSDRSLMKDVKSFDSSYKPASDYLEPQKPRSSWVLTSDSDLSDIENGREAKLIALKSRVRQSAANLFLVVFKVKEKRDTFGYWWALLPDCPVDNWLGEEKSKKTLAYCAVVDPVASSRASALSVILALLSGSRSYLAQAETSKKNTSFIPFSVSLGYIITCLHKILITILECERNHAVIIVALKCAAALVQATPYHKMQEGLISGIVRSTRKFLVHRDVTLQVASLVTIGCVLSVDPKVEEILQAMEKDQVCNKSQQNILNKENVSLNDECDDFEEGYSDDEMFTAETVNDKSEEVDKYLFKSWILDICFKNMGWLFRSNEIVRCKPSTIPVILESLQVLSAIAFHHLADFLSSHIMLLGDILKEMLKHEHQDVVLQAARTISIIGDALQKLEQQDLSPPLSHCVYMWETLLTPLSLVLQNHDNAPAKAVVCDCIANIGEKCFKQIPDRSQRVCCALLVGSCGDEEAGIRAAAVRSLAMTVMYRTLREDRSQRVCCALLVGSCGDEEAGVRAAAVRSLAMTVMYRTLREDICFVSDCGENILRALAEPTAVVRTKAAWALGNLSDALVLNMEDPDIDDIDDDLLLRLLEVSVRCADDNDKVKMSATRGLGNLLRLIKNKNIQRYPQLKTLCQTAIEKLLDCACKGTNMKVRWNACHALGNSMKNDDLFTTKLPTGKVFPKLCTLTQDCKNLKVRITAAVALRVSRTHCGQYYGMLWRGVMAAMENAANVDDYTEYRHKDNLVEQLCVTLAHLCCLLKLPDLADILDPLVFHFDCAKSLFTQLHHKLPPENVSYLKILEAAKYVTVELVPENDTQSQTVGMLQELFIWDV
ncbi:eg:34f3.4 protein [Danaus plexippus plexippus]|uniref:HEAT repeat-containing protein 6 n=1 Tax=Danaus plexippus plexippus TaxID=278856 RepID=A0A212FFF4_DANPL|nr:eg:34f3.4 protein [Danaus plexippus plexippus]